MSCEGPLVCFHRKCVYVDEGCKFRTGMTATGVRFLLTGFECKAQTRHNDLLYWPGSSLEYFMIETKAEEG